MRIISILALAAAALALAASPAAAAFGLTDLEVISETAGGGEALQAGSHPYALTTQVAVQTELDPDSGKVVPSEELKDLYISFPSGLVGNPTAVPQCSSEAFLAGETGECENASAIGVAEVEFGEPDKIVLVPVYNLEPTRGFAAKLGFIVEQRAPVAIDVGISPGSPHEVLAKATNVSQALFFLRSRVTIWGTPADPSHDPQRGTCALKGGTCPSGLLTEKAFLTLPTDCVDPLTFGFEGDSWQNPDPPQWFATSESVGGAGTPLSPIDCGEVGFEPVVEVAASTAAANSPSGLDFKIDVDDPGLSDPTARAESTIEKAEVTLPEGMTLNPSAGEGLASCSQADLANETPTSAPGAGCPEAAKVGSVEVETPLLEDRVQKGSIYIATPYENPFGSLLALYVVIKDPEMGILVKLGGSVDPDPLTGRLQTTFGEAAFPIPQIPFSHFRFSFNSGPRAPLTTPPGCGTHTTTAVLTPSSGGGPLTTTSSFETTTGPGGGPCPPASLPFLPGLTAGSIDATAGAFSPFFMRLTRSDTDQEITRLSSLLPPGLTGKIAGLQQCPQAAVEAARAKSGAAEQSAPSCPDSSLVGHTLSGSGVGPALTYVPGSLYLAGPFAGAPLSIVAIVPALAGPFDLGTVVVQEGLDLNPDTAQVEVKGDAAEAIPRILQGIPLELRDLRIMVDRPGFTLNPTSCEPAEAKATLTGVSTLATLAAHYQASNCGALKFKPKLTLSLKGKMKRTGNPAITAVVKPRTGDANIGASTVLLPPSLFIDNAHISNPCTRVQFNENACPKASILGKARAFTPLLDQPLVGPVYFRSNGGERELPDVVADLHGQFHIVLVGFVDSKHKRVRTRFLDVPDAPVSKFVLRLAGGRRGLLENSADLCRTKPKARLVLVGQNGKRSISDRAVGASCKSKGKRRR